MVSCIFSRSFSGCYIFPVIFSSRILISGFHRKISSRRYPMSQKFFEMLLIFPTVFSPVEPSYLPLLPNGNFCIGLADGRFLQLRLISLLPIQNSLIEKVCLSSWRSCPCVDFARSAITGIWICALASASCSIRC